MADKVTIIVIPESEYTIRCQHTLVIFCGVICILDDQPQMDSKPAGQPEHASLNQCLLITSNRPEVGALGTPQQVVEIRFLSNVIDARALIGPCSNVTMRW